MITEPLFHRIDIRDGDEFATIGLVAANETAGIDLFQKLLQSPTFRIDKDAASDNYIFSIIYTRTSKVFSAKKLYSNSVEDLQEEAILLKKPDFKIFAAYENEDGSITYINDGKISKVELLY